MNKLQLAISFLIATSPAFVHGEYPLYSFACTHPRPSLGTIIDFLHEHRHDTTLCSSITYSIHIQRKHSTSILEWFKIIGIVAKLMDKAQKSTEGDMHWANIFGTPIKESILASGQESGIHGTMNIQLDSITLDSISIKVRLSHDYFYDEHAWTSIIKTIITWMKQGKKDNTNIFKLSPLFEILRTHHAGQDITIKFKDEDNNKIITQFSGK